jgi:hypothetical protein
VIGWFGGHVETAEIILGFAIVAYLVDRFVDSKGWSRTSRTLRSENVDLVRRNDELEKKVERLEINDAAKAAQIIALERHVTELKERDQLAVIQRLDSHEVNASKRHGETLTVLTNIADRLERG